MSRHDNIGKDISVIVVGLVLFALFWPIIAKAYLREEEPLIHPSDPTGLALVAPREALDRPLEAPRMPQEKSSGEIEEMVRLAFPDAPVMYDVARAESRFQLHAKNPKSSAYSVFQILAGTYKAYGCTGTRGIAENEIKCARKIFDVEGTAPWDSSGPW